MELRGLPFGEHESDCPVPLHGLCRPVGVDD